MKPEHKHSLRMATSILADEKDAYEAYYEKKLKEWSVDNPHEDLPPEELTRFYHEVDEGWKADNEYDRS